MISNYKNILFIVSFFQFQLHNAKHLNDEFCLNKFSCYNEYKLISEPNNFDKANEDYQSAALCDACVLAVPIIRKLISQNKTEHFQSILTFICKEFKLASPIVCEYFVKEKEVYF